MSRGPGRPRKATHTEKNEEVNLDISKNTDLETAAAEKPKPKKRGTKPGWKPAGELPKLKAKAGYTAKWAAPSKLTKYMAEGWEIMKPEDNVGDQIFNVDINKSGSLTGELRYRDMVAIMLPNELKEARDEWLSQENEAAMAGVLQETDEKLSEMGVQTFKPKGQEGRVVID